MKTIALLTLTCLLAVAVPARASDRVAVYARVDKVVLEPSPEAPNTIQIWGVFSVAKPNDVNDYEPPARGYLYFELSGNRDAALKEWADLRAVAGTSDIVSFGNRFELRAKVRKAADRPANPQPYVVSMGMTKVHSKTDYAPVHALIAFKD
jgi:hypothetical protein